MFVPIILLLAICAAPSLQFGPAMGPVGRVDIKKIQECPKFDGWMKATSGKNAKGQRVINAVLNVKEDFNKNFKFILRLHKWTGSEWKKDMMKYTGPVCEYLNKFMSKPRDQIYKSMKVAGTCDIKKGRYELKDVYITEKDCKIPTLPYGTFQMEMEINTPKNVKVVCVLVDFEHNIR